MGYDVYGEIYYGIPLGEEPWDEENDRSQWYDPKTEELMFATDPLGSAYLIELGNSDSENYLLGFEVKASYWGEPVEITSDLFILHADWDEEIKTKCKILGIEYIQPKLYLSAYFSY